MNFSYKILCNSYTLFNIKDRELKYRTLIFYNKTKKKIIHIIYTQLLIVLFHEVPTEQAQVFGVGTFHTIFPGQIQCPK
jgi:hypothetical protein